MEERTDSSDLRYAYFWPWRRQ